MCRINNVSVPCYPSTTKFLGKHADLSVEVDSPSKYDPWANAVPATNHMVRKQLDFTNLLNYNHGSYNY